jgi:hypothetical protein
MDLVSAATRLQLGSTLPERAESDALRVEPGKSPTGITRTRAHSREE